MHRNRSRRKQHWPTGLYEQNGYYKFLRVDGTTKGLGRNKTEAFKAAQWYNSKYRLTVPVDHIEAPNLNQSNVHNDITLSLFISLFQAEIIPDLEWSESYLKNQNILLNTILKSNLSDMRLDEIQLSHISSFLNNRTPRMYNRYRSLLILLYKHAIDRGLVSENIPIRKLKAKEGTRRRMRLSKQLFIKIRDTAPVWLKNAMNLSLQTSQGRLEVANMKTTDISDGLLHVTRKKVESHEHANIAIPVSGLLADAINDCNDGIKSPFLVHKILRNRNEASLNKREHFTQVTPEQITREFTKIVRSMPEFQNLPEGVSPPTFHEIRSLSIYLMEAQGYDAQKIACHSKREMTDHYKKGHSKEYIKIEHIDVNLE